VVAKNKYATTNSTHEWVAFYLKKDWYITAFKVINAAEVADSGMVKMSFKSDRPFNPYYVSIDYLVDGTQKLPSQETRLNIYFVSNEIVKGEREARPTC